MRLLLFHIGIIVATLAISSCVSISFEIHRSKDNQATFMAPWKSRWDWDLSEPHQTVPLKKEEFVVIARRSDRLLKVQHYSSTLRLVRDIPVSLDEDEAQPRLFQDGNRLFYLVSLKVMMTR